MSKTIQIKCSGSDLLPIDSIIEFQGNLKKLSKKNLEKLKTNIINTGFVAPIFVWFDQGDNKILDGHQRLAALISLRQDGYDIPLLPVDYIHAESEAEARKMLLSITSQYGEFELDELNNWLADVDEETRDFLRLVDDEIEIIDIKTKEIEEFESKVSIIEKPYNKVHVLLSMDQDVFLDIIEKFEELKKIKGVEYEQSQN